MKVIYAITSEGWPDKKSGEGTAWDLKLQMVKGQKKNRSTGSRRT